MDIRSATIRGWDAGTYTATVEIAGSLPVYLAGVPVARNIAGAEVVSGRPCAVLFFDEADPAEAVIIAIYV